MSIEIGNLILLLAAAQGLFLAILIFHKHGRLFANRFLGALILMFSLILVHLFLMEKQQPHTNSELTLNQLAEMPSISAHNLSEIINTRLQQNFFDFVNAYRLEKVKKDLADPAKRHLTLLAIAFDAGFNSKSSFNLIFKKQTNLTPSEYRWQALTT